MPKYIVSQPEITLCIASRSSRSPVTTSAPLSRNACARSSSIRTIARTALPCCNSSSVTVRPIAPTRPAAPVTRMGFAMFLPPLRSLTSKGGFVECGRRSALYHDFCVQGAELVDKPLQSICNLKPHYPLPHEGLDAPPALRSRSCSASLLNQWAASMAVHFV